MHEHMKKPKPIREESIQLKAVKSKCVRRDCNLMATVLVMTVVVITATHHSVVLSDHRVLKKGLFYTHTPGSIIFIDSLYEERRLTPPWPIISNQISTWMNFPFCCNKRSSPGRGSDFMWQDGSRKNSVMKAAHLRLLDEVHKYRRGSLIILSHR